MIPKKITWNKSTDYRGDYPYTGRFTRAQYRTRVKLQACVTCGGTPVEFHHPICGRYSQRKCDDYDGIPQCKTCHDLVHRRRYEYVAKYGRDYTYIPAVRAEVENIV